MKKKTTLIALGVLASTNILPGVVNAESIVNAESRSQQHIIENETSGLHSNTTAVLKSESQQTTTSAEGESVNNKNLRGILPGDIEYSANSTEFFTGDQYRGTLHLTNDSGNTISAGTKVIVSIPSTAVDYSSWDFSDSTLASLFDVSANKDNGTIIFTLKADIIGTADVSVPFNTTVIGPENTTYPVTVSAQNSDGTFTDVVVNNDQIIIPEKNDPNPTYGLLNMYWGTKGGTLSSTFLGKNPVAIDGISTGVFSRKTNDIQNFIEINPEQKTVLENDEHYEVNYEIHSTKNLGSIDLKDIQVLDATSGAIVPKSDYTVSMNKSNVSFIFARPDQSTIQVNHKYVINITSLATNDGDVYNSNSKLQIKNDNSVVTENSFGLNNIFTSKGSSVVFPNINANNKVYNVGELTSSNIVDKLMIGVSATDSIDGNLSSKITMDYKDLLSKKDTIGVYPEQVSYSVTNSLGFSSTKPITVTIVDNQKGKDVTVKYVDEDGNKISEDVVISGIVGDSYTTEQKDISGYTFKEVQGNATGQFTDKTQTVTYVYTKNPVKAADVTAKYVDTEGNKISDDVVKSGIIGEVYTTEQKIIAGYTFKEVQGNVTGTFTDQAQTVTYVYTKDPVKAADVTAKYVDTKGNKISDDVVKSGNVGDDYSTEQKDISGYTFKEVQGSASGKFTDEAQTVTYVYTKNPVAGGNVTAKYVDEDGNKISEDVVKSGNVGDNYVTDQKIINGYTFKEVQGSASGKFTDQAQTVTYVYTKNPVKAADVTAKYVDTEGNKISDDVVKSGNVGDDYSTEQKDISGYTFKEVQGSASGKFTDQAQTVTYVYTKNPVAGGNVTAKYVDEDGNKISEDVVKSGNVGENYVTDQETIDGYTFKEIQGSASGKFTVQAQTVTYVYTKNNITPAPKSDDNNPSHKENTHMADSSSTHDSLPETGENERMTLMSIGTGLILLMITLLTSIYRFNKSKNN